MLPTLTKLHNSALQEKVQSDAIVAEFPPMTDAERKAQAKAEMSEKLRAARELRTLEKLRKKGYIYVIGSECEKYPYKIGLSKSPVARRLNDLQTSHWAILKVFYESPQVSYIDLVERELHKKFAKKRVRGEWFNLTKRDITYIAKNILVLAATVQSRVEMSKQKKKENTKKKYGVYDEREMFDLKNDMEVYLFSKNLPPYLMVKNCSDYIDSIGMGCLKRSVEHAINRSNEAYKKKYPRLNYFSYYKHNRMNYLKEKICL